MTFYLKKYFMKNAKRTERETQYNRSDYDKTFETAKMLLRCCGVRMTHKITKFASFYWSMYFWFEFLNIFIAMCLEFVSMGETARGGSFQDAIKIIRMMPCNGVVVLSIIKSFMMVRHRPVFENLITEIGAMWPRGELQLVERAVIDSALKQINFVVKGYFYCNNYLILSFLYPPFWELIKRMAGQEWEMMLHFFYWLPFDPCQPIYYEITLLVQTWHAVIVIWLNMSGDLLFCIFLSHITTQFDLLSVRIKKLVYVPLDQQLIDDYPLAVYNEEYTFTQKETIDTFSDEQWMERHQKELTEIVLCHRALIRLSGDVEAMFSFSLLVNFLNSSVLICFCGFCSVVVEKWNETAYKSFLLAALSQTWFLCWYGQKLLESSEGVANALYNSGWYRASKKIRSSILYMLHRSQKGVKVTTFGFSVISLASYTKIINTAWSYFTLLMNFYKQ